MTVEDLMDREGGRLERAATAELPGSEGFQVINGVDREAKSAVDWIMMAGS